MTTLIAKLKSTIFYKRLRNEEHNLSRYIKYLSWNISWIVYRIVIIDAAKEKAIQDFLSLHNIRLHNRNISAQKIYREDYCDVKNRLKLTTTYLKINAGIKVLYPFLIGKRWNQNTYQVGLIKYIMIQLLSSNSLQHIGNKSCA